MTQTLHNPLQDGYPNPDTFNLKGRGDQLSNALANVQEPTVLAVDGPWGSGKSYFLQCFKGACSAGTHQDLQGAHVVYVDAFREDYLDQPLMSLMQAIVAEVDRVVEGMKGDDCAIRKKKEKWGGIKTSLKEIAVQGAVVGGLVAANAFLPGSASLVANVGAAAGTLKSEEVKDPWEAQEASRKALEELRIALKKLVKTTKAQRLIFIVDELDRCRPDYALRMLEVMKHVFDVEGCHFVLGVNQSELAHSVRAIYGQGFDGEKYLQRFVHVVMPWETNPLSLDGRSAHERMREYLSSLGPREHTAWFLEPMSWVDRDEFIGFRDIQRIYHLGRLTGANQHFEKDANLVAAFVIMKICNNTLFERLKNYRHENPLGNLRDDVFRYFLVRDLRWPRIKSTDYVNFCDGLKNFFGDCPANYRQRIDRGEKDLRAIERKNVHQAIERVSAFNPN